MLSKHEYFLLASGNLLWDKQTRKLFGHFHHLPEDNKLEQEEGLAYDKYHNLFLKVCCQLS